MLELSLHILDLIENAVRASATVVCVSLREDPEKDLLEIAVEDNGPGLAVQPEQTLNPFYTTKEGKRTGLGLSLFRAATEQAGGQFTLERSAAFGGVAVRAVMRLHHVDRAPLGDLSGTLFAIMLTHPEVDFWCRIQGPGGDVLIKKSDIAKALAADAPGEFTLAHHFSAQVQEALLPLQA